MAKGKIIKLLNRPIIKAALKSIPFVGDIVENMDADTPGAPQGTLDTNRLLIQAIRLGILAGILYLVFSGKLSMEEAENYKEFLNGN